MEGQLTKIHDQNNHFYMVYFTTRLPLNYKEYTLPFNMTVPFN